MPPRPLDHALAEPARAAPRTHRETIDWAARSVARDQADQARRAQGPGRGGVGRPVHLGGWYYGDEVRYGLPLPRLLSRAALFRLVLRGRRRSQPTSASPSAHVFRPLCERSADGNRRNRNHSSNRIPALLTFMALASSRARCSGSGERSRRRKEAEVAQRVTRSCSRQSSTSPPVPARSQCDLSFHGAVWAVRDDRGGEALLSGTRSVRTNSALLLRRPTATRSAGKASSRRRRRSSSQRRSRPTRRRPRRRLARRPRLRPAASEPDMVS